MSTDDDVDEDAPMELYEIQNGSLDKLEKILNSIVGGVIVEGEFNEMCFVSNDSN